MKHPVEAFRQVSRLKSQFTSYNYVTRTFTPSTFGGKHVVIFLVVVGVKVVVMANSHRAGDEAPETIPQVGHVEPGRSRERLGSPKETGSLEKKKKPHLI